MNNVAWLYFGKKEAKILQKEKVGNFDAILTSFTKNTEKIEQIMQEVPSQKTIEVILTPYNQPRENSIQHKFVMSRTHGSKN